MSTTEPVGLPFKNDVPQTLVGISFPTFFRAQEFLTAATGLAVSGKLRLIDAVIVVRDADGKTMVRETIDPTPGRSALSGAAWAGLFGLILGGPVGWAAGMALGAAAGATAATIVDLGIPDDWVAWFKQNALPNSTTLAILVEGLHKDALVTEAGRFEGAQLVYANLDLDTIERIKLAFANATTSRF